ncbi:hypothetical protein J3P75_15065 [Pseudomonas sp. R1-1]|uniref:LPO_1073/Vpar_1526 family protein n=1 Tax=Pseudomonas sp. R1-1 TaxID=1602529 RepID=UPI003DA9F429
MLNKDQNQEVGAGALAIQAGGNVTVGISVADARAIALDVAKATFYELTGAARDTMSARVEEITEKVISQIERDYPEGLKKAVDPDFQHALYTVQKNYGRTGDVDLGDLLVDLLVDRSKQDKRDLLQIVLNESLEIVPKLTSAQVANLSMLFLCCYTIDNAVVNDEQLGLYFDKNILPLADQLVKSASSFQHLQFTGCGSAQMISRSLEESFLAQYPGLFSKGFTRDEADVELLPIRTRRKFLMTCLNDSEKLQVRVQNAASLTAMYDEHGVDEANRLIIDRLFNLGRMSHAEVRAKCMGLRGYMEQVFSLWSVSDFRSFTLTSVGMAIGHANMKRIAGNFGPLSQWIE